MSARRARAQHLTLRVPGSDPGVDSRSSPSHTFPRSSRIATGSFRRWGLTRCGFAAAAKDVERLFVDARVLDLHGLGRVGERLLAGLVVGLAARGLVGDALLGVGPRLPARGFELLLGRLLLHSA